MSKPNVIFVVDKLNLVLQQKKRFEEYLTNYRTSHITGADAESQYVPLKILLKEDDIVVLTAQILVDALKDKTVRITDISLLVFDECHHANKNHAYNQIMQAYLDLKINGGETKTLPQVKFNLPC
jgi:ERCC4-related helicase